MVLTDLYRYFRFPGGRGREGGRAEVGVGKGRQWVDNAGIPKALTMKRQPKKGRRGFPSLNPWVATWRSIVGNKPPWHGNSSAMGLLRRLMESESGSRWVQARASPPYLSWAPSMSM